MIFSINILEHTVSRLRHRPTRALEHHVQNLTRGVDLLLTRQKEQDISSRFAQMNLHHRCQGCLNIICLRLCGIQDLNRERSSGNREDRTLEVVLGKLFRVQRCGRDDQFEIFSSLTELFQKTEENVCTCVRALVFECWRSNIQVLLLVMSKI